MIAAFSETYNVSEKTELLTSVGILWYSTPFVAYVYACAYMCRP